MKMRLIIIIAIAIITSSCKQNALDPVKAAAFIEEYINKTGNGDFTNLSFYYSEEMKNGEDDQTRQYKIQQLNDALGKVEKFEKVSSKEEVDANGDKVITLTYKVKHTLMSVTELYKVKDENGILKIAGQNIESIK